MLRMFARRIASVNIVSGGSDQVLFGISLPSDTVIHDIRARVSLVSDAFMAMGKIVPYAIEGWILPVLDPDSGITYDTLWDTLVPKDTDVQTMDLDTGAADATPFYEPGEADWTSLFDVGLRPERLYHRHRFITATSRGVIIMKDSETPFLPLFVPGDDFVIHIGRRLRVRQPSALVFAAAMPSTDDTTSTLQGILGETEWPQVKYMSHVLERALLHVLGVVEAGAETPWEEATALLQKHLDPDVFEELAAKFTAANIDFFVEAMIDHSVVGALGKAALTTGR